jgi:hypothetical protein
MMYAIYSVSSNDASAAGAEAVVPAFAAVGVGATLRATQKAQL